jgi:hypothetical protein
MPSDRILPLASRSWPDASLNLEACRQSLRQLASPRTIAICAFGQAPHRALQFSQSFPCTRATIVTLVSSIGRFRVFFAPSPRPLRPDRSRAESVPSEWSRPWVYLFEINSLNRPRSSPLTSTTNFKNVMPEKTAVGPARFFRLPGKTQ